jgi:DNA repair exonuclease SbcCD ATPase subunit
LLERIRERSRISVQEFQQNRAEIQRLILQNRTELQNQIQNKRAEMKSRIEALKAQLRERLRERISERKREIVERIYDRINALNERMTDHYLDVLYRLEKILERIESRTAKAKLNGKDVSKVEEAIQKAHQAINTAREAVKTQAEKVYQPPEITTEEKLKLDVGKLRQQLHDDLKAVEKLVKDARDAVRQAAVALAQIPKVDELEVPTTTETTTQPTQ